MSPTSPSAERRGPPSGPSSVADAAARILALASVLEPERVPLRDALQRVLAERVVSPITIPAWDNSAMDGYAVRGADIAHASQAHPVTLTVVESVTAGGRAAHTVVAGTAVRVMTGAATPAGADTVVRVEDTDWGTDRVRVLSARDSGKNVRPRGEDLLAGAVVAEPGQALGAAQLGVLASVGAATVSVHRRPRVAFLASGDEIVDLDRFDEVVAGGKTVTSNGYTIGAMIVLAGGVPIDLGIARDDPADLRARMMRAREERADLLITSAGISAGERDYVRTVLADLGASLDVWKVSMRPGAPVGAGRFGDTPWVGLPGNPVSTMVTFELFVRPMIRRMLGHSRLFRRPVPVTLEEPFTIQAPLTHFLRAIVSARVDGSLGARLTGPQGSAILSSMARANALLIVPADRAKVDAGESVNALLLGEDAAFSERFAL